MLKPSEIFVKDVQADIEKEANSLIEEWFDKRIKNWRSDEEYKNADVPRTYSIPAMQLVVRKYRNEGWEVELFNNYLQFRNPQYPKPTKRSAASSSEAFLDG